VGKWARMARSDSQFPNPIQKGQTGLSECTALMIDGAVSFRQQQQLSAP